MLWDQLYGVKIAQEISEHLLITIKVPQTYSFFFNIIRINGEIISLYNTLNMMSVDVFRLFENLIVELFSTDSRPPLDFISRDKSPSLKKIKQFPVVQSDIAAFLFTNSLRVSPHGVYRSYGN